MQYLNVQDLSKRYGEKLLFEKLSFIINQGEKVALLAANGTGKSSLIRALADLEPADSGQIQFSKGIRVDFLLQDPKLNEELTVLENVLFAENPATKAILAYEDSLHNPNASSSMEDAIAMMDAANAWGYESRAKELLSKLKCPPMNHPTGVLSGGEKKRVALAKVLINEPDFLVLDEPTNHLDLEMIEWLEAYLTKSNMTLLMVTHDRYFLENICTRILEIDHPPNGLGGVCLYNYTGNYSDYVEKKQLRRENEAASVSKAQNLMRKEKEWMSRMPKARGTKSKARIESFYELKKQATARRDDEEVALQVNPVRLGSKILELHNIAKSYDEKVLFQKFEYKFQRFDKVGVIGPNGSGKSTFIKTLTGEIEPDTGKVVVGETVKFGIYNQDGLQDADGMKVIDVVRDIGEYLPLRGGGKLSAVQLLERFLFPKHQHYVYVSKLSGGEKRRLYLLTVLMQNPNFLILDEPTNDLDILTLNVLEDFLMDFDGCLLIVSHDRYFMDKLVDHVFVFGNDGEIADFPGNYSHYRIKHGGFKAATEKVEKNIAKVEAKEERKLSYEERKQYNRLEKEIEKLEASKVKLEQEMAEVVNDFEALGRLTAQMKEMDKKIDEKSEEWLILSEFI